MTTEPIDPAVIMAEHQPFTLKSATPRLPSCRTCGPGYSWPCLPWIGAPVATLAPLAIVLAAARVAL